MYVLDLGCSVSPPYGVVLDPHRVYVTLLLYLYLNFFPLRWTPAKLFHEQLSLLAESNENIEHLRKLWAKIQEGISAQVCMYYVFC